MQNQAVEASKKGARLAQQLADVIREMSVVMNHVNAAGLAGSSATALAELQAFNAWDQSDDTIPTVDGQPVAIQNPKWKSELETKKVPKIVNEEHQFIDGVAQYDEVTILRKDYNPTIKKYIYKSSVGLEVLEDGTLLGADLKLPQIIGMLQVAGLVDAFAKSDPDSAGSSVGARLESLVTV